MNRNEQIKAASINNAARIALWEHDIAHCEQKLAEAEKYGNVGDILHYTEQIRWARHKIEQLQKQAG